MIGYERVDESHAVLRTQSGRSFTMTHDDQTRDAVLREFGSADALSTAITGLLRLGEEERKTIMSRVLVCSLGEADRAALDGQHLACHDLARAVGWIAFGAIGPKRSLLLAVDMTDEPDAHMRAGRA